MGQHALGDALHAHGLALQAQGAGFQGGCVKQVVDERRQARCRQSDDLEKLALSLLVPRAIVQQRVGVATDGSQW